VESAPLTLDRRWIGAADQGGEWELAAADRLMAAGTGTPPRMLSHPPAVHPGRSKRPVSHRCRRKCTLGRNEMGSVAARNHPPAILLREIVNGDRPMPEDDPVIRYRETAKALREIAEQLRFDPRRANQIRSLADGFERYAIRLEYKPETVETSIQ
jgi:hypothetical protein